MTFWDFVAAHPWWTLLYLGILCGTVAFVAYHHGDLFTINSGMNAGQFIENHHHHEEDKEFDL